MYKWTNSPQFVQESVTYVKLVCLYKESTILMISVHRKYSTQYTLGQNLQGLTKLSIYITSPVYIYKDRQCSYTLTCEVRSPPTPYVDNFTYVIVRP